MAKEYRSWAMMKSRCSNPKDISWYNYGARGIKVCERWLKYENFLADMGRAPSPTHSIDRINSDGDYEPANCKWSSDKEQGRNRKTNNRITFNGETKCISAWAEEKGMLWETLKARLKKGWSVEKALTTPLNKSKQHSPASRA